MIIKPLESFKTSQTYVKLVIFISSLVEIENQCTQKYMMLSSYTN